ncbi:MAG: hypothetical protein ABSD38_36200 [Syntrophorhabdales bacterium]|jgi:hypothetical protein
MGQTSRIVTIVDGVQVTEVTTFDHDGNPMGTYYLARGEKHETLKQAMTAARGKDG